MPDRSLRLVCCLLIVGGLVGCREEFYRCETVLRSDGTVYRAIYQPQDRTPSNVRSSNVWQTRLLVPEISPEEWDCSISRLSPAEDEDNQDYFAAWGEFPSVDDLPDHFIKKLPGGVRVGRLERRLVRIDYVFVTEYLWEERLADVVTLDDMHRARRELADQCLTLMAEILQEACGGDYVFDDLIAWLRDEGVTWWEELTDAFYEVHARGGDRLEEELEQRVRAICRRHGLILPDASAEPALRTFAEHKLRTLVRRQDGRPPDPKTIDAILCWLSLKKNGDAVEASRLQEVSERVINNRWGSRTAWEAEFGNLWGRIVGVYGPLGLQTRERFTYSLAMPGRVVETSGQWISENRVRWIFDASEAYPLGYSMTCRSLQSDDRLQKKLLGARRLADRQDELDFVALIADDQELMKALRDCANVGHLEPLYAYRRQLADEARAAPKIRRLWKLLKLPRSAPP